MADKMNRCFSKQTHGFSNPNNFFDVRDHRNPELHTKEENVDMGSKNPTPCSKGYISSESIHGALQQHLASFFNARNEFLYISRAFRQEMSRLENTEEALFNNIMKGTANELHLTSLQMQFEVCSMLFNQLREQKVLLLELISQNIQKNNNRSNIYSRNNLPAVETTHPEAYQKSNLIVENSIESGARMSSTVDVHSSVDQSNNFSHRRRSCGRTRLELNRVRFGHSHGMFATFGNEQFCFRMNHGTIRISHLILENIVSLNPLQVRVRRGKTRLSVTCGRALSVMNTPIPVFCDPREDNTYIYYVGHYLPLQSTTKELSITACKEFSMHIILEFVKFDDALARDMNTCVLTSKDARNTCIKSENFHSNVKEEEEDYLLFHNKRNCIFREASTTSSIIPHKNDVSSSEGNRVLSSDDRKSSLIGIVQKSFSHISCGRSRQDLNKQRVGHNHGMFASFGNQDFCFRKKQGSIQISHLILNNHNDFGTKVLTFWIRKGKTRLNLNCGRALSKMNKSIPVFFDPKDSDQCIYYVGHWMPVPFTTKELTASSNNEFSMRITLRFNNFDVILARELNILRSGTEDDMERTMVKQEEEKMEENHSCPNQSTHYHTKMSTAKRSRTSISFACLPPSPAEKYTLATLHESALRRSCGRTRENLNKMNLGHRHGMFASFGNQEFCFRKKTGCIQISHLIVKSLGHMSSNSLDFWIHKGKTRLNLECGRALSEIKKHIPVFLDPKEEGRCIYYIGHWIPSPLITVGQYVSSDSIRVSLKFSMYDSSLASDLSCSKLIAVNERASVKEEDVFLQEDMTMLPDLGLRNPPYHSIQCLTCAVHVGTQHHPNSNNQNSIFVRENHPEAGKSVSTLSSLKMLGAVNLEDQRHNNCYDLTCSSLKRRRVSS